MEKPGLISHSDSGEKSRSSTGVPDNPGIRFPPPAAHLLALVAGAVIHFFLPVTILPDGLARWVGGGVILLALILAVLSFRPFKQAGTTVRPDRPASALVTSGIYRYSRNPNYLSMMLLFLGLGIGINSLWILALLVPVFAWLVWRVVPAEERYLERAFGPAYRQYQRDVRRWL